MGSQMNVLQVVPELNAGGVERTTIEIAEALHIAGHVAHVASAGGWMESELMTHGTVLHKFAAGSKNPLRMAFATSRLIDIIKKHSINIVHARSRSSAWSAWRAARRTDCAFVTTFHGIYKANNPLKRTYNSIMTKGEIVIANSEFTKAHIIRAHRTSPDIIRVIPRGVDMAQYHPASVTGGMIARQRQAWGVSPVQKIILLPGRLTRWKGQTVAIRALEKLPENFTLICLGDARGRNQFVETLRRLAREFGVDHRVKFPGHSTDMPTALMSADIVISTSIQPEAFGRVMAEAQAMGRPVIASALGGSLETVKPGETGMLVPPDDPDALSVAILDISDWRDYDPVAARAHIMGRFSKKSLQAATLRVYQDLL